MVNKAELYPECSILEPSAGNGAILEVLAEHKKWNDLRVTAVELNDDKFQHINGKLKKDLLSLQFKEYAAYHSDFLKWNVTPTVFTFDRIIAAPPFKDNVDLAHIKHMYANLSSRGILVSLTTPYWMTNNEEHQVRFRSWLASKSYSITMLPDMTFAEKGKTVPTAIIKIYK